ncbi:MAG: VacB/RNase II family 3'-5' exoribonuclease [Prevotellaceae bacterium]|jgi:ribonuclease R|nr:VacB/RNase II family 3'-5' exoribonuclease [Prevotellaceae bacterium]
MFGFSIWRKVYFLRIIARRAVAAKILRVFELSDERVITLQQLSAMLDASNVDMRCLLQEALRYLMLRGHIEEAYPYKYRLCRKEYIMGVVDVAKDNAQSRTLISLYHKKPIFILPDKLRGALPGDTVWAALHLDSLKGQVAEVTRVVKFACRRFSGSIEIARERAWFIPEQDIYRDIVVPLNKLGGAKDGDAVMVEIDEFTESFRTMHGKVVQVLGARKDRHVDFVLKLEQQGFSQLFTPELTQLAQRIAAEKGEIPLSEYEQRRDLRDVLTFTVDPKDVHEIDDAISIRQFSSGRWEVGVHIADVSHYIPQGSAIDLEARRRGTSVYLYDKVIPMLPQEIVELCTLLPREDKLAFSVIFEFSEKWELLNFWMGKTIIRSDQNFSYHEVSYIIAANEGRYARDIQVLYSIATMLKQRRAENGALFFHSAPELKFDFDDNSFPIRVHVNQRNEATMMVEELMLLANRTVAQRIGKRGTQKSDRPFVYRVHGLPHRTHFDEFVRVAQRFGYVVGDTSTNKQIALQLSSLLEQAKGKPEETLLASLALKAMSKARYTHKPKAHYGLAFEYYAHFTSPMRRYADLAAHRLLEGYHINRASAREVDEEEIEKLCAHLTLQQQRADLLEDECRREKAAEYMESRMNHLFTAVIFNFGDRTMSVELRENGICGQIFYADLIDDQYFLNRDTYTVIGMQGRATYRLGDWVRVKPLRINEYSKNICFSIEGRLEEEHDARRS